MGNLETLDKEIMANDLYIAELKLELENAIKEKKRLLAERMEVTK